MKRRLKLFLMLVLLAVLLAKLARLTDFDARIASLFQRGGVSYLTPEQEAKTFVLEDGYSLQLVLSDPIIKEPVLTVFDGNGRMFVAEMRTFMQDISGRGQKARTSRVSVHWSSKHDGTYDRHAVFADHLLLPRMILPYGDGVLINETDSDDYYLYRDTKGDGVADSKTLFYAGGPRGGNLEHQPGGIIWCMDNCIYTTVNTYRLRVRGTNVVREETPPNMGQWGLCQDDHGKPWFINAGFESGPLRFQAPIIYGIPDLEEQTEPDWATVRPLVGLADVEGGAERFRPGDNTLNHFTSTCGDQIYRGDRLPADLRGDLLYAEPVGRLVRRDKVLDIEGLTRLHKVYPQSEFIRSTDPNFRPVNLANAPDGSIYITDMYRGVIEDKQWLPFGSYLRRQVLEHRLDQNVGRGRIWRLVHQPFKPGPQPNLISAPSAALVQTLSHSNGWWRDTAQQMLVLRGDKACMPQLKELAQNGTDPLARIHAIWTLEGLGALDAALLREKFDDPNPPVRAAAIRASESLYKSGDHSLVPEIIRLAADRDPDVAVQSLLTASLLRWPGCQGFIDQNVSSSQFLGVKKIGWHLSTSAISTRPGLANIGSAAGKMAAYSAAERQHLDKGQAIYYQLCFACHGVNGEGAPLQGAQKGLTLAPALGGSSTVNGDPDAVISIVLKGLTGPVDGRDYTSLMVPMESYDDEWIASVTSFIRSSFGNHSTIITDKDIARVRLAIKGRETPWTIKSLGELKARNP